MGKPVEVRVLSRAVLDSATYLEAKTIGKLRIPVVLIDYFRPAVFRRAAQRAFINCDSLFLPAGVGLAGAPRRIEESCLSRLSICRRIETASSKALTDISMLVT